MNKILIIDDEVQIRSLLARMLELEGYEVCQAGDCKAALKQLEIQSPDVALCDVFLPDGNGVDLVLNIKKIAPNVEVILLTAHGNIPDGVQAIKNGAFDYITKGDDNNKIIPLISRAVEKAKMNVRLEKLEKKVGQMYSFDSILGAAGGIADGRQLAAALALGACGVQVGTCLLVSEECPIHENYKAALLNAKDSDTIVTGRIGGSPVRVLKNRMSREYVRQEKAGADKMELEKYTLGSLRRAVFEGDTSTGSLMAGQVAGMLHEVRPVADILDDLWNGGRQRIHALSEEC